jgi:GNAT superfamily N-acetyltransferase
MANVIKRLAQGIFRDYSFYHIYRYKYAGETPAWDPKLRFQPVEHDTILSSKDEIIVQQAWYHGEYSVAYACMEGARIIALCFFWYGERYSTRNFWPLSQGEAKLVQIVVLPDMRGQGIASSLIRFAAQDMYQRGFGNLYARIWWSNTPSVRAFERAQWRRVAAVVDACLVFRKESFRLRLTRALSGR